MKLQITGLVVVVVSFSLGVIPRFDDLVSKAQILINVQYQ